MDAAQQRELLGLGLNGAIAQLTGSSKLGVPHVLVYLQEHRERKALPAEVCICAALRLTDGRLFRGHRHADCIRSAFQRVEHQEPGSWRKYYDHEGQGFITSFNRYVDRVEGLKLQLVAGIESAAGGYRGQLYSEDLY